MSLNTAVARARDAPPICTADRALCAPVAVRCAPGIAALRDTPNARRIIALPALLMILPALDIEFTVVAVRFGVTDARFATVRVERAAPRCKTTGVFAPRTFAAGVPDTRATDDVAARCVAGVALNATGAVIDAINKPQ